MRTPRVSIQTRRMALAGILIAIESPEKPEHAITTPDTIPDTIMGMPDAMASAATMLDKCEHLSELLRTAMP